MAYEKLIAQDTAGTFDCNNIAYTAVEFNNLVVEDDDSVIEQASSTTYTLKSSGHYLVIWNVISRNDADANRRAHLTKLFYDGVELGWGSGSYSRDANEADRPMQCGAAIIDIVGGDDLELKIKYRTNDPSTHLLEADRSSLQIIKLDDDLAYYDATGHSSTYEWGTPQGHWKDIEWDTDVEKDAGFTHDTGSNPDEITLDDAGLYLVTYNLDIWSNANSTDFRRAISTKLIVDSVDQPQSYSCGYTRERNTGNGIHTGRISGACVIKTSGANEILKLVGAQVDASTFNKISTRAGLSSISIVRLPATAEALILTSTTEPDVTTSDPDIIIHDTEVEEGSAFAHDTGTGRVTVGDTGDYLFLWCGHTGNRTSSDQTRLLRGFEWYVNAAKQDYGVGCIYARGYNETDGAVFVGGGMAGSILSLTADDIVDIRLSDEGGDGYDETLKTLQYGMSAISFGSLTESGGGGPANVAKINGVELANIAKINGVEIANIAKINGVA